MGTEKKWSLGNIILVIVCLLICAICLIPMLSLLARSLSSSDALVKHEVYLLPKGLNFQAYTLVLKDAKYIRAFFWTVFLTVAETLICLFMTTICAYPLIFKELKGRNLFNVIITITMFFNAGTIPNYLLMKSLGLLDSPLVLLLPGALDHLCAAFQAGYGNPGSLLRGGPLERLL